MAVTWWALLRTSFKNKLKRTTLKNVPKERLHRTSPQNVSTERLHRTFFQEQLFKFFCSSNSFFNISFLFDIAMWITATNLSWLERRVLRIIWNILKTCITFLLQLRIVAAILFFDFSTFRLHFQHVRECSVMQASDFLERQSRHVVPPGGGTVPRMQCHSVQN